MADTTPIKSAAKSNEQSSADHSLELSKIKIVDNNSARPNPLFEYPDYTYSLSLHIVPPEKWNEIMNGAPYSPTVNAPDSSGWDSTGRMDSSTDPRSSTNAKTNPNPANNIGLVLVASGGKRNAGTYNRNPYFNEDFYFDSLTMKTVNGLNNASKNSNAIELHFTLIEPYGVTFLDRLWLAAARCRAHSWSQIPYMIQIDFVGNDDAGKPLSPIVGQTKYIPIKLINCKVKITSKGAEYDIHAVPFNQSAFDEGNASTPANFEVSAKTIKEFFDASGSAGEAAGITGVNKELAEREEATKKEISEENKKTKPDATRVAALAKTNAAVSKAVKDSPYVVGSYTAAMNSYQKQLVKNNYQDHEEIYAFDIHPDILDSEIVNPKKNPTSRTELIDPVKAIRAKAGITGLGIDFKESTFSIAAGTNLVEVINLVMRSSKYIRDQVTDPDEDPPIDPTSDTSNPLNWYRITSTVEISDFDMVRDVYSKKITYHVYPTAMYNSKFPHARQSQPKEIVKQYDYIYTGKNDSIINFDITFDAIFFTTVSVDRGNAAQLVVQPNKKKKKPINKNNSNNRIFFQNKQIKLVSGQADIPNANNPDTKAMLVNDLYRSSLSSQNGDMISISLKIIGDPELIKQDDIFFNVTTTGSDRSRVLDDNNSIMFDNTDRYAKVTFKTPVDFDQSTGFMITDTKYTTAAFSGIYKILIVDNEFRGGQFTQTLQLIRIFDNLEDPEGPNLAGGEIAVRAEAPADIPESKAVQLAPPVYSKVNGPSSGVTSDNQKSADSDGEVNPGKTYTASVAAADATAGSRAMVAQLKDSLANVPATPINGNTP